jgi:NAD-dependent DNA ligase
VIELIRSGDVIPHIRKVIVPAEEPKMPLVDYKWNDSKVDILLENILDDENVKEKIITGFFKGIEVDGLSSGNVTRICCGGYDSIGKILKMKTEDFLKIDGFKIKMATKLYDGIQDKIKSASLIKIMSVSNLFGRGFNEKKIETIMQSYPLILLSNETKETKIEKIISVKGIARKTAEGFVERINDFIVFLKETQLMDKLKEIPTNISTNTLANINKETIHPLYKKSIVMTGFRDKDLENKLKMINANIMSSVSKNTFLVLVKNKEENTSKILEAKKMQIPLMTIDEFIKNYNI